MTTLYYQYGDERLYTHPISVDAKVEEGVLTLKAVNVCSSCFREGSVMKERIDTVPKLMR